MDHLANKSISPEDIQHCYQDCSSVDFKSTMTLSELNLAAMYEFLEFLPSDAYQPDPR